MTVESKLYYFVVEFITYVTCKTYDNCKITHRAMR